MNIAKYSLLVFFLFLQSIVLLGQCDHLADYIALRALYLSTGGDRWDDHSGWPDSVDFSMHVMPSAMTDMDSWYGINCSDGRVVDVNLSGNNLGGEIPEEMGGLCELTNLSLRLNQLSGSIPESLGNLNKLIGLFLYDNNLVGVIPETLGSLNHLQFFRLNNNQLTGIIPRTLGDLHNLKTLYLSNNHLTGSIPDELTQLSLLEDLNLDRNNLTGSIPTGFGNLNQLQYVFLYENNLSGCIPTDLSALCDHTFQLWGNPLLPWQGEFMSFCGDPNAQIGAPCNDGISDNGIDVINSDCSCGAACISIVNIRQGPIMGVWNDNPNHWSANHIPTTCDQIIIPSPYHIIIPQNIIGLGQTLDIEQGALLDVLGQLEIGN